MPLMAPFEEAVRSTEAILALPTFASRFNRYSKKSSRPLTENRAYEAAVLVAMVGMF
jgi:hypothetical protein